MFKLIYTGILFVCWWVAGGTSKLYVGVAVDGTNQLLGKQANTLHVYFVNTVKQPTNYSVTIDLF